MPVHWPSHGFTKYLKPLVVLALGVMTMNIIIILWPLNLSGSVPVYCSMPFERLGILSSLDQHVLIRYRPASGVLRFESGRNSRVKALETVVSICVHYARIQVKRWTSGSAEVILTLILKRLSGRSRTHQSAKED